MSSSAPTARQPGVVRTVAVVATLAVLVAGGAGYAVGRTTAAPPADTTASTTGDAGAAETPEPGSVEAIAAQLAEQQAAERADLAADLSAAGQEAYDRLMPVLAEVSTVLPVGGGAGAAAEEADVDRWLEEVAAARAALEAVPDGTSEHTVTRAAFLGAVDLLDATLRELRSGDAGTAGSSSGRHVHLFLTPDGDPDSIPSEFAPLDHGSEEQEGDGHDDHGDHD
ncbi:hypothetical protein L600_004100000190 [Isoptericola variabilis J7]|uniref:hypothetical protein n=1 Tax=Isoptericola variabilis TaxID=139208 RepID=UPI0011AE1425|nr:hypothetical protein [Isoptericola variabilis]TWH28329.1 hypothetical protein L600_004100000190 [Isoptericola variabilis J7]